MEIHIRIIGFILIALSALHIIFPKYFNWKEELEKISLINKELMIIHTMFIGITVFLIGLLCITSSFELSNTDFGKRISIGIGVFWLIRLFVQFFGYSSELWKGKKFETIVHILFSLFWAYMSFVFIFNYYI